MEKKNNPGPVENLLMKLFTVLLTWLLTTLSTRVGRSKDNGTK